MVSEKNNMEESHLNANELINSFFDFFVSLLDLADIYNENGDHEMYHLVMDVLGTTGTTALSQISEVLEGGVAAPYDVNSLEKLTSRNEFLTSSLGGKRSDLIRKRNERHINSCKIFRDVLEEIQPLDSSGQFWTVLDQMSDEELDEMCRKDIAELLAGTIDEVVDENELSRDL